MEVSVIIVSMNNYEVLSRCLYSIRTHTSTSYEVFVVAYLFSPENLQHLRQNYPWAQIIESNEIRGFSANNNLALRKATGKYCFVLNDDTKIESDVITSLAATFDQLPSEAAVVSPKLLFADHSLQYCGRPEINWKTYVLAQLGLWREKTVESPYTNRIGIFRTYNLVGAAFMIKTDIFRQMGFFDEYYFFCPEDIALSTALNRRGYFCYVNASVELIHYEGASSGERISRIKAATMPAGEKGTIRFLAGSSVMAYISLTCFSCTMALLRSLKYRMQSKTPGDNASIMSTANRNVVSALLTKKTPKEIFVKYYGRIKR